MHFLLGKQARRIYQASWRCASDGDGHERTRSAVDSAHSCSFPGPPPFPINEHASDMKARAARQAATGTHGHANHRHASKDQSGCRHTSAATPNCGATAADAHSARRGPQRHKLGHRPVRTQEKTSCKIYRTSWHCASDGDGHKRARSAPRA